jgi:hypothetical protein
MTQCCPCDVLKHPGKPEIPAGLSALSRQLAGFPEYRLAMLRDIPTYPALAQWRARQGDDLGLMLMEMWAYMLDILSFYDERIANETYLRTALQQHSLHQLVGLIGYRPRPALAATVMLAAIADGHQPVVLPPRTGFRSDAFDGEPPQIFETELEQTAYAVLNEWSLAPVRAPLPQNDDLLLDLGSAQLAKDQTALLRWGEQLHVGKVTATTIAKALDGNSYLKVEMTPSPALDLNVPLDAIEVLTPTQSASLNLSRGRITSSSQGAMTRTTVTRSIANPFLFSPETGALTESLPDKTISEGISITTTLTRLILDTVYADFAEEFPIIVQRGHEYHPTIIQSVAEYQVAVSEDDDAPTLPATSIEIEPPLPDHWIDTLSRLKVHFQMTQAGTPTQVAKTQLDAPDFVAPGIAIEGLHDPLPDDIPSVAQLFLQDANDNGLLAEGTVTITPDGEGHVQLEADTPAFQPLLRPTVKVYANVIAASRGESVLDEVLGSGNAAQAFQSFQLRKSPLTYLNDPAAPEGRRSTLSVRVNGFLWTEVPSFFGFGPQDEVYIVRQNDQQETTLTFGDGQTGARIPTGINNVTATYRFGAGAAKPPAGTIGQLAKPVTGLRRVVNPVAAGGGKDSDQPDEIRANAPSSALLLGRAISLPDFEALAREFGGVINAKAGWAWEHRQQRAVVKVWFIADGGDIAGDLQTFLIGQAEPNTPLVATEATAQAPSDLVINLEVDLRANTEMVIEAVRQTLTNEKTGLLSLAQIPIGAPLFRSRLFEAILGVNGAQSVQAMTVNGRSAPCAITTAAGHYRNFLDSLVIQRVGAGDLTSLSTGGGGAA